MFDVHINLWFSKEDITNGDISEENRWLKP